MYNAGGCERVVELDAPDTVSEDSMICPVGRTAGFLQVCALNRIGVVVDNVLCPRLSFVDEICAEEVGTSAFNNIGLDDGKPCPRSLGVDPLTSKLL
jgi:hypothetical protein